MTSLSRIARFPYLATRARNAYQTSSHGDFMTTSAGPRSAPDEEQQQKTKKKFQEPNKLEQQEKQQDFVTLFEANGDYRRESSHEDASTPLYKHQESLPRLPVPSLEETIATFLPTALAFVDQQVAAEKQELVTSLMAACQSFPQQAAHLQQRLLKRQDEFDDSSWLQKWWNQNMYLQTRDPLFHISYLYRLADDDSCRHNHTISRAAAALQAMAVKAQAIESGQVEPDTMGRKKEPLCSTQYKYLFSACRIPRRDQDSFRKYASANNDKIPTHAVVVCRGQFFEIPLVDSDGCLLNRASLENALQDCVNQSSRNVGLPELGWLTATDRDTWADTYALLTRQPELKLALEKLQSALCLVALDVDDDDDDEEEEEESPQQTALRLWHGNIQYSANRWCDKTIQLIIGSRGQLGYAGEHSMADGMPSMTLCQHLLDVGRVDRGDPPEASTQDVSPKPIPLFERAFESLDEEERQEIQARVDAARNDLTSRIQAHELQVQTYIGYGSAAMKQSGFSPDAFAQMAMQLAGYRLFGQCVGTYEATQTRRFLHGRTETIRSVSPASRSFVEAMGMQANNGNATLEKKRELLDKAVDRHSDYTRKALRGLGVDRHFFGLSMLQQEGEEAPDLFSHPLFLASKRWRMSTSTVPGVRTGFANVEADGIGIGYDIQPDVCTFTITGRREFDYVNRMSCLIHEALDEMKVLFPVEPASSL